jgi:GT2 family glycosyltransferase
MVIALSFQLRGIDTKKIITFILSHIKKAGWVLISFIRRNRGLYHFARAILFIKKNGIKKTIKKFDVNVKRNLRNKFSSLERELLLTRGERLSQENTVFSKQIKISIITPLYNTQEEHLVKMIESVAVQTYSNWELCLADGSDIEHENVKNICEDFVLHDNRIKYMKLNENLGVSGNSNKAIEMSGGEYIGLLEHDDVLHPSALYEIMKVICKEDGDFIYTDEAVFSSNGKITLKHYKPDYAVDTLCSHNYISRFTVFSRTLMDNAGKFRSKFDGSQDYDLILRYTHISAKVRHISRLLYFHRKRERSNIDKKLNVISSAEKAITEHLNTKGIPAQVESKIGLPGYYRVIYELTERPLVSIIIPNKDNAALLRGCLSSIMEKTTYNNYEIIIVENNSTDNATINLYRELSRYANIHILYWEGKEFNFSEISNMGCRNANGKQLIFLNNDIEIITPDWIEEMLMYCQRDDVGAVGSKLYFSNRSIQHAGVALGIEGTAKHILYGSLFDSAGYMGKLQIVQNMSAVTGACMMVRRKVFEEVGLFAPEFHNSYNDVDLCIRIRKAGYLVVWTPYAEAYHYESKSRGYNTTDEKKRKLAQEMTLFKTKWKKELAAGDPYYNRNFSLDDANYSIK